MRENTTVFGVTLTILCLIGCSQQSRTTPAAPDNSTSSTVASISSTVATHKPTQAAPGSMYFDGFNGMSDAKISFRNGTKVVEGQPTRGLQFFAESSDEPIVLQGFEDSKSLGPDKLPGVLSLSWQTVPSVLGYSGFVYQQSSIPLHLPYVAMAKTAEDLEAFELRFRYKGINANSAKVNFPAICRIEPDLPDAYPIRLELSFLAVTDQWQEFSVVFGDGKNAKAFLASLPQNSENRFRVVWSQTGKISNYHSGDTLLIDDLDIIDLKKRPPMDLLTPAEMAIAEMHAAIANGNANFQEIEGLHPLNLSKTVSFGIEDFKRSRGYPWPVAPRGALNIVGIPVQVAGATVVWGKRNADLGAKYPHSVGVDCDQSFETLYILHNGFFKSEPGTPVFDVVFNYADGQSKSDTIRFGEDSRDFFMNGDALSQAPTASRSTLAWVALGKANGKNQRISFNMTAIQNPRIDQVVESLEIVSSKNDTAGCILAITVGKSGMIQPNPELFK